MSKGFENFMDEYQQKQTSRQQPTEEVNHEAGTIKALCTNGGAAQSSSASLEPLILAHSCLLLSRAMAYVGLSDLNCARELAVEIRDHLDAIKAYAMGKGIGMDLAVAMLNAVGPIATVAPSDTMA